MVKKVFLKLLAFYQKYISTITPNSCRYYPSCSEYAKWRIENENIFRAIFFIFFRILRCNQLFNGGIEYPKVKKRINRIENDRIKIKYWLIPKEKNRYLIIKNFS